MNVYLISLLATFILFHLAFLFAVKFKRNDIADVLWGPGFVVAALAGLCALPRGWHQLGEREWLILIFLSTWASRLFWHIGRRFLKKQSEDTRYAGMRAKWGANWLWRSYLLVFVLQGILLLAVDSGVLRALEISPRPINLFFVIGASLWVLGFIFETVSDRQLRLFSSDARNKGRIMNTGLWKFSRHPNYFGEVVQWWGLFLMSADSSAWWTIVSPLLITFLILKVSGIPMLEELMGGRPGYAEYKARTSVFIPWPPG